MEGKRAVAAAAALCCLLIVLLSGQPRPVAAMSKFCRCYKQCYPECRTSLPRWVCVPKCMDDCSPNQAVIAVDCGRICRLSICGTAASGPDAEACVDDCTKWRQDQLMAASAASAESEARVRCNAIIDC
ncbi:hypothetical protein ACP70R_029045 [Stipagrostis hirtigluma subsp. patula]